MKNEEEHKFESNQENPDLNQDLDTEILEEMIIKPHDTENLQKISKLIETEQGEEVKSMPNSYFYGLKLDIFPHNTENQAINIISNLMEVLKLNPKIKLNGLYLYPDPRVLTEAFLAIFSSFMQSIQLKIFRFNFRIDDINDSYEDFLKEKVCNLAEMLQNMNCLLDFGLFGRNSTLIYDGFKTLGSILMLDVSDLNERASLVCEIINRNKGLRMVRIKVNNELEEYDWDIVLKELKANTSIETLCLKFSNITECDKLNLVENLCELIKTNKTIKVLDLSSGSILKSYLKNLSEALKINTSIEVLDLSDNEFGDEMVNGEDYFHFSECFKTNQTIQVLSLREDKNGERVMELCEAIMQNNKGIRIQLEDLIDQNGKKILPKNKEFVKRIDFENKAFEEKDLYDYNQEKIYRELLGKS